MFSSFNPNYQNYNPMGFIPPQYQQSVMRSPYYHIGREFGGDALGTLIALGTQAGRYSDYKPTLMQTLGGIGGLGIGLLAHKKQNIPDKDASPEELEKLKYERFRGVGSGNYGADYDPFDLRSLQEYSQWNKEKNNYLQRIRQNSINLGPPGQEDLLVESINNQEKAPNNEPINSSGLDVHSNMEHKPLYDPLPERIPALRYVTETLNRLKASQEMAKNESTKLLEKQKRKEELLKTRIAQQADIERIDLAKRIREREAQEKFSLPNVTLPDPIILTPSQREGRRKEPRYIDEQTARNRGFVPPIARRGKYKGG